MSSWLQIKIQILPPRSNRSALKTHLFRLIYPLYIAMRPPLLALIWITKNIKSSIHPCQDERGEADRRLTKFVQH